MFHVTSQNIVDGKGTIFAVYFSGAVEDEEKKSTEHSLLPPFLHQFAITFFSSQEAMQIQFMNALRVINKLLIRFDSPLPPLVITYFFCVKILWFPFAIHAETCNCVCNTKSFRKTFLLSLPVKLEKGIIEKFFFWRKTFLPFGLSDLHFCK